MYEEHVYSVRSMFFLIFLRGKATLNGLKNCGKNGRFQQSPVTTINTTFHSYFSYLDDKAFAKLFALSPSDFTINHVHMISQEPLHKTYRPLSALTDVPFPQSSAVPR